MNDELDSEMLTIALIFADVLDATIEFGEELEKLEEEVTDAP